MTEDKKNEIPKENEATESTGEYLPPLEFSSLVLPFFTHALVKLGQAEDPKISTSEQDLQEVQRMIDLIDLLKNRTQGNLKPEEQAFLDAGLHQLRMAYMEKKKIIKL